MGSDKILLHAICEKAGVGEPARLREPSALLVIYGKLDELKNENYSFYEWSDAVCYITDRSVPFRSKEEALRYLCMYIRSKVGIGRGRPRA